MRKRTEAREYALQQLYKYDITAEPVKELDLFWVEDKEVEQPVNDFALVLVAGAIKHLERIDKKISGFAANWELKRMAAVDRNVLRLGAFELLYLDDIPAKVSINEAVDLAKKYSGEEAGKFVNGILDSIKKDCGKA